MFVRRKNNSSGSVSVQVINKHRGKYTVYKTIGSSSDPIEIESLYLTGQEWIRRYIGQTDMFSAFEQENIKQRELKETERVLDNVANVLINGTELILSRVLWVIERAYRITKGTLEMRPMFHFTQKRIEAHVCICFVAYKVYKELERILLENNINLSVVKVLSIAKTVTTIRVKLPHNILTSFIT